MQAVSHEPSSYLQRLLNVREPGFLGPIPVFDYVPYLALLRLFVVAAAAARTYYHYVEYGPDRIALALILVGLGFALAGAFLYISFTQPPLRATARFRVVAVLTDVGLISGLNFAIGDVKSDFFYFYFLPLFSAAEYLELREFLLTALSCLLLYILSVTGVWYTNVDASWASTMILSRVIFPRTAFYVFVMLTSALVLRAERQQRNQALASDAQRQALLDLRDELERMLNADSNTVPASPLEDALGKVANRALPILKVDSVSLHVQQPDGATIAVGAGRASPGFLRRFVPRKNGIGSAAIDGMRIIAVDDPERLAAINPAVYEAGVRAILAVPLNLSQGARGVMYAHQWSPVKFGQLTKQMAAAFAHQLEYILNNALLLRNTASFAERGWGLIHIQQVLHSLTATHVRERAVLLGEVVEHLLHMLRADRASLHLMDGQGEFAEQPIVRATAGGPAVDESPFDELSAASHLVRLGRSRYASDIWADSVLVDSSPTANIFGNLSTKRAYSSCAAVLLHHGEREQVAGIIFLEYITRREFTDSDQREFESLSTSASIAIATYELQKQLADSKALTDERLRRQNRWLRALHQSVSHAQNPDLHLEARLRALMTGVTAGSGLGFSRCGLFLVGESGRQLVGKMAIGATRQDEADETWREFDCTYGARLKEHAALLEAQLSAAEEHERQLELGTTIEVPLSAAIRRVVIPLDECSGVLKSCIESREPAIARDGEEDAFRIYLERISEPDQHRREFVVAPLLSRDRVLGVLFADRRFLNSDDDVFPDLLEHLGLFCRWMAASIESEELRRQAERARLVEAMEYSVRRTAHRLGGRIAFLGGATSILYDLVVKEMESHRSAVSASMNELFDKVALDIQELGSLLSHMAQYGTPVGSQAADVDLRRLLLDLRSGVDNAECRCHLDLPERDLMVRGDSGGLRDVFLELVRNAIVAMADLEPDKREIRISASVEGGAENHDLVVLVTFSDSGPGIPLGERSQVFELSLGKRTGRGLGLDIVRDLIRRSGGAIALGESTSRGATFVLRLPLVEGEQG